MQHKIIKTKRGSGGHRGAMKAALWMRFRNRPGVGAICECYWCHIHLRKRQMTVDHFLPLCKGGDDHIQNLVPACDKCNRRRSELDNPENPKRKPTVEDLRFFLDLKLTIRREQSRY